MIPTVLVVGCGNIGRRHIEALIAADRAIEIVGVEPNDDVRLLAERIVEPWGNASRVVPGFDGLPAVVDLLIVATPAASRRAALEAVLDHCSPKAIIFEKVLFTTTADLESVGQNLSLLKIPAFVNCGRRGFSSYDSLKKRLASYRGATMAVHGAGWNLGSNAVHFLDLAEHVLGDEVVSLDESGLDPRPAPARIPGCVDLFGTLRGDLAGGGSVVISQDHPPGAPLSVTFSADGKIWRVDEGARRLIYRDSHGQEIVEDFETRFVSGMSDLYMEILDGRGSRLTPYAQSARQHKLFIDAFRHRINLSVVDDVPCPIS